MLLMFVRLKFSDLSAWANRQVRVNDTSVVNRTTQAGTIGSLLSPVLLVCLIVAKPNRKIMLTFS